jgi:hypothetical protein
MPAKCKPEPSNRACRLRQRQAKVMRAAKATTMNLSVFIRIAVAEKMARDGLLRAKGPAS